MNNKNNVISYTGIKWILNVIINQQNKKWSLITFLNKFYMTYIYIYIFSIEDIIVAVLMTTNIVMKVIIITLSLKFKFYIIIPKNKWYKIWLKLIFGWIESRFVWISYHRVKDNRIRKNLLQIIFHPNVIFKFCSWQYSFRTNCIIKRSFSWANYAIASFIHLYY